MVVALFRVDKTCVRALELNFFSAPHAGTKPFPVLLLPCMMNFAWEQASLQIELFLKQFEAQQHEWAQLPRATKGRSYWLACYSRLRMLTWARNKQLGVRVFAAKDQDNRKLSVMTCYIVDHNGRRQTLACSGLFAPHAYQMSGVSIPNWDEWPKCTQDPNWCDCEVHYVRTPVTSFPESFGVHWVAGFLDIGKNE